ncbi:hypothetical protein [Shewanella sp. ENK2]|uniref:hypothetical protein n=1 Tax=Shewanella sp. ENK2 TaxID=2775245 RepID=UPI00374A4C91
MPKIRFNFFCHQPIALYAKLCNQYINDNRYFFTTIHQLHREQQFDVLHQYCIEVEAEENQLTVIADEIAERFLYSVWLERAEVIRITERIGSQEQILHSKLNQYFCHACSKPIADHTIPADISFACQQCHGENNLKPYEIGYSHHDIAQLATKLIKGDTVELTSDLKASSIVQANGIRLSLLPLVAHQLDKKAWRQQICPQILVTNPERISRYFHIAPHQVHALSSLEKPSITILANKQPSESESRLSETHYQVCFADSRLLLQLSTHLRLQGIDWLYIDKQQDDLPLSWVNLAWVANKTNAAEVNIPAPMPRHDIHTYDQYQATYLKETITCKSTLLPSGITSSPHVKIPDTVTPIAKVFSGFEAASCALHAGILANSFSASQYKATRRHINKQKATSAACIYLSNQHPSCVITQDTSAKHDCFLMMPDIAKSGVSILAELDKNKHQISDKFQQKSSQRCQIIKSVSFSSHNTSNSLERFIAVVALFVLSEADIRAITPCNLTTDAETQPLTCKHIAQLAAKFHQLAQSYNGNNAPRIDFPLCAYNGANTSESQKRSINWQQTLSSVISFMLADASPAIVAFGFFDSLADYLSNWMDHLDQEMGLDAVVLAGSDFRYSVLADRLCLRLGKNYPIVVNRLLDLDGANLAVGGLFLAKRRRY